MSDKARSLIFSCPAEWKKRKVEITKIRAGEEEDFERAPEMKDGKPIAQEVKDLKQVQNAVNNKEWVDLDRYIELLLDSKSEDEIVFIYCNPNLKGDPYDLKVCSYDERNEDKYYTMSGKGLSCHEGDHVTEFISLAQWLINRDSYNHIKELRFFKKFKKWKFMRIWKDTIKKESRKQATNKLKDKLFILHDTFKTHLLTHRDYCKKMEDLRFVDMGSNIETQKLKEFSKQQAKMRQDTHKRISQFSSKCRENIEACINKVLQDLKQRIDAETKLDEERKRVNPVQSTTTLAVKDKQSHNAFEELGFPPGMTYGHSSSLREECSRFIRFAYLVDFMCYDSLSGIYLGSIDVVMQKLRYLDSSCNIQDLMSMDLNDVNNTPAAPVRGHDPLFLVNLELKSEVDIQEADIVKEEIEDFKPPPHGTSLEKDFDLLTHLELEPEPEEGKEEEQDSEEEIDPLFVKKYRDTCPNIHRIWLKISPSREDFCNLFERMFIDCNNEIKAFERFSKHPSMKIYADALEEWDDRIGDNWDAPDDLMLDPVEWIKDNKEYTDKTININEILRSTYEKAEEFTSRFGEILQMYWIDKRCDFNILVNQRLKNPTDSLQHTINLLLYQDEVFGTSIPSSTNVGLIKLDSKKMKNVLTPMPKICMQKLEHIIPQTIKERLEEADKWLTDCTRKLTKPAGTVDEFVEQNANLTYTNDNFQNVRDKVALYEQYFNIMANSGIKGAKDDSLSAGRTNDRNKNLLTNVVQSITKLANLIMNVENFQDSKLDQFRKTFDDLIPKLNNEIEEIHNEANDECFLSGESDMAEMLNKLDGIEEKYKELETTSIKYQSWQEVLQMNQSSFENLEELREDFKIRADMWRSLSTWEEKQQKWIKLQFSMIDAKSISEEADQYAKVANRVDKILPPNPIGEKLKLLVGTFRGTMPVVLALRNSDIQESHMQEIKDLLQNDFDIFDENFTLNSLIEMNVVQYQEEIDTISTQASQEASLRRQIHGLDELWKKIDLITKPYKDGEIQILDEIEDVFTNLDDSLALINTILGSRYVKPLRSEAENWKKNLFILNQVIEEWVICQKQWIYLENILKSPDIKRHLPNESAKFEKIDTNFKKLMDRTK